MARIIENKKGRRLISLNSYDILAVVKEYQSLTLKAQNTEELDFLLNRRPFFLAEEIN